jgi:SAM-dependent methyltransferase
VACGARAVLETYRVCCSSCGTAFERIDGIPIMVAPGERDHVRGRDRAKQTGAEGLHSRLKRLCTPPTPSAYVGGYTGANRALAGCPQGSLVLDVGSGIRRLRPDVVNLDIDTFENVDVVANATRIPFADETFDLVISEAVLEHVPDPRGVVSEMIRVLQPGGQLYVDVPFLQGFHADPHDYQRYTLPGLDVLLAGFEPLAKGVSVGPSSALAWMLREYLPLWAPRILRTPAAIASAWLTTPIKYLDRFVGHRPGAERIAAGLYFWGRKRPHARMAIAAETR